MTPRAPLKLTFFSCLFTFFFLVNSAYLTSCSGDNYEFDEAEMRSLLDDLSAQSYPVDGYTIEFDLHQASNKMALSRSAADAPAFIQQASACGNRTLTFVAGASACISSTDMAISGTIWIMDAQGEVIDELSATGNVHVLGNHLSDAEIWLSFERGELFAFWSEEADPQFYFDTFYAEGVGPNEVTIDYTHDPPPEPSTPEPDPG